MYRKKSRQKILYTNDNPKNNSKMKILKNIRACFGLKNSSLVNYLECSEDMVNSILNGRRIPNLNQLQGIIKLDQALEWNTPVDELENVSQWLDQERAETSLQIEAARTKCAEDLLRKRNELAALQNKRGAWLRGLHACTQLLQTDLGAAKRKWVALRQRHLEMRLKERGLFMEQMLEAEIVGLEKQLDCLEAYSR